MDPKAKMGLNRTGMATSPLLSPRAMEMIPMTLPTTPGDDRTLAATRIEMAKESDPMGTLPPPATVKELVATAGKMMKGEKMIVFVDKLGERLAFERSGTRLYDAAISKFDAYGTWVEGPTREDLVHIRTEEHRHFKMLVEVIASLGSDPTAITPSANVHAVASLGLMQVITDPRTSLKQTMEAILIAELADNDCWENLMDLAESFERPDLVAQFGECLKNEQEHLRLVRMWLGAALSQDAAGEITEPFLRRAMGRDAALAERIAEPIAAQIAAEPMGRVTAKTTTSAKSARKPRAPAKKKKAKK